VQKGKRARKDMTEVFSTQRAGEIAFKEIKRILNQFEIQNSDNGKNDL
jgi:hypothetical protein